MASPNGNTSGCVIRKTSYLHPKYVNPVIKYMSTTVGICKLHWSTGMCCVDVEKTTESVRVKSKRPWVWFPWQNETFGQRLLSFDACVYVVVNEHLGVGQLLRDASLKSSLLGLEEPG